MLRTGLHINRIAARCWHRSISAIATTVFFVIYAMILSAVAIWLIVNKILWSFIDLGIEANRIASSAIRRIATMGGRV